MKRKTVIAAACAAALSATCFPMPLTQAASEGTKYEFEDGVFYDCEYGEGLTWSQFDEDANGNPCDMTGWSGDGFAYIDDKDSSVALKVNVDKEGLYQLKINYIQCFDKHAKIQYLYVNGESQGEVSFPFNSGEGWTLLDAGYVHLNKGENEIKIVSYWGYTCYDYLTVSDAPDYITKLSPTGSPCNPNATQAAKNLYDYLCSVYGNHILAGQQEYCGSHCYNKNAYETEGKPINFFESNEEEFEYIQSKTGKQPAVRGIDFLFYNTTQPYFDDAPERVIAWYKEKGGIPTVTFHWNVPTEKGSTTTAFYVESTGNTPYTTFSISKALEEGTWENEVLMADLKLLAEQFKKISDADVPVIFRPLHEAEGAWFWWGAEGPEPCKKLYALIQDTLQNEYGCNNIIWEWTTSAYVTSPDWYPGDDRVDLLGVDKYNAVNYQPNTSAIGATFFSLVASTEGQKMVAMSENDTIPSLDNLLASKAGWLYFCPWYKNYLTDLNSADELKNIYTSDYCITLDELPDWDTYKPSGSQSGTTKTTTSTTTTTTTTSTTTTETTLQSADGNLLGDATCDKIVDISDAIAIARLAGEDTTITVTKQGKINADCNFDGKITAEDGARVIKYIAMLISKTEFESGK
ncbi:MAG: dockerin type I domain-containing protein [Oscillospiraceae bacterium]|nr:dockerin type I domain-containing protein [Oscillospiraceae bacterium]